MGHNKKSNGGLMVCDFKLEEEGEGATWFFLMLQWPCFGDNGSKEDGRFLGREEEPQGGCEGLRKKELCWFE